MSFETLPVLHLDDGRFPEYPGAKPEAVLTTLARRFGRVVVVDVAGVRANDADLEFVSQAGRRRPLWVDAGSRYATDAMDLFVAGAELVTMRWNTLQRAEELAEAAEICQPGSLFLALEFPHGAFLPNARDKRSADEVARYAAELGVGLVLVVDSADEALLRKLPEGSPRYLQGPVEPARAEELGFAGLLLAPVLLPAEEPA